MARPLCSAEEIRALDKHTIEKLGVPGVCLMETAGRAVADAVQRAVEGRGGGRGVGARNQRVWIAILAGSGNNGGDGSVCGRTLLARGQVRTQLYLAAPRDRVKGDALVHLTAYEKAGGTIVDISDSDKLTAALGDIASADVVCDALLGTGLKDPVRGALADVMSRVGSAARGTRIAVDLPSGLSTDTGQALGPVIRADVTVTFGALKRGLACYPGVRLAGRVELADIGLPRASDEAQEIRVFLAEEEDLRSGWARRTRDGNKGTFGHLLVVGGSAGMTGAALLAATGALRSGVGKVTVAVPHDAFAAIEASKPHEVMCRAMNAKEPGALGTLLAGKDAVTLGVGLGRDADGASLTARALSEVRTPLVIDADGLFHLANMLASLDRRTAPTVLTPHPGEMARLVGSSTAAVQSDRIEVARQFAREHKVTVVLKGAGTVVAAPDGEAHVIPFGNPGMATAGTGDVLAGVIGALVAGQTPPFASARLGALLHALAGDEARKTVGEAGMVASDLFAAIAQVLRAVETGSAL